MPPDDGVEVAGGGVRRVEEDRPRAIAARAAAGD
jgi:hypothetical protein